jgi:hypothetical protein
MKRMIVAAMLLLCGAGIVSWTVAQAAERQKGGTKAPKFSAEVPPYILTPNAVRTRIGTLRFRDGAPDDKTVQLAYDQLDFGRGVEAFMVGVPAASVYGFCEGFDQAGVKPNQAFGISENLLDARSLLLTPNTTVVYLITCLDLSKGPVVLQAPPNVLGPADDAYFRWIVDIGLTGPDQGKGGKYLFVPPGYSGALPADGYFIAKPRTNGVFVLLRAFVQGDDIAGAVQGVKAKAGVYPLEAASNPPATTFVNVSGKKLNTIHANNFHFYEELNTVVQREPADFLDPETVGLFASIGIKKGIPFAPDARMKSILTDAVAVGNAAARSLLFATRDKRAKFYPDRQWLNGFIGGSYAFRDGAELMLDARTMFHYYATGITPAMAAAKVGTGSAYAAAFRDSKGRYLDGSKTYKITLPAPIPAKNFWSFVAYDNQTRSLLETDQRSAGIDSNDKSLKANADGSYTVWFGPKAPAGHEGNWVQTWPGKGWNALVRLYGPLQPWFDKTWKPGDFELVP